MKKQILIKASACLEEKGNLSKEERTGVREKLMNINYI